MGSEFEKPSLYNEHERGNVLPFCAALHTAFSTIIPVIFPHDGSISGSKGETDANK